MAPDDRLPLLRVRPGDVAAHALVVGDPARAEQAAALLRDARRIGANREYVTYTGHAGERRITIASHGVGSSGAGVCFEELARAGTRVVVRAGTCGALQDAIVDGDLVVASGAVRDEGLTARLVPDGYPAVADHRLTAALEQAAGEAGARSHTGIVLSTDVFYPSKAVERGWAPWRASRVLAVEMEVAALFVVAALHGLAAGAVLTVDGNPARAASDMSDYDPYRPVVAEGKEKMLRAALAALERFAVATD